MKFYDAVAPAGVGWWFWQILPPLTILLLVYVPVDLGTAQSWLVAMLAALISALWLFARLIRNCLEWNGWAYLIPPPRPVLTIVFLVLVFTEAHFSYLAAQRFARSAAAGIQQRCDRQRRCPDAVPGWQTNYLGPGTMTRAGLLSKYWIQYRASADRRTFIVHLRQNIDYGFMYSGGVGKPVKIDNDLD